MVLEYNYIIIVIVLVLILIVLIYLNLKENFYNPPSSQLFEYKILKDNYPLYNIIDDTSMVYNVETKKYEPLNVSKVKIDTKLYDLLYLDKTKNINNDPIRFHSRLYSPLINKGINKDNIKHDHTYPYFEKDSDYSYEYEIPSIMNFTKYSAENKYKKNIKGVDINRRMYPGFEYPILQDK